MHAEALGFKICLQPFAVPIEIMTLMKFRYSILTLVTTLALASCGAPVAGKFTTPAPGNGYIYGIFELPKPNRHCGWGASFILQEVGTSTEHQLSFSSSEPVGVFPVRPGRYQIAHVVAKNCSAREVDRQYYSSPVIAGEVEVKPDTAIYIGSYAVQTYTAAAPNGIAMTMVNLTRQCRDFASTTERFLKGWPAFSTLQSIDGTSGTAACIRPAS